MPFKKYDLFGGKDTGAFHPDIPVLYPPLPPFLSLTDTHTYIYTHTQAFKEKIYIKLYTDTVRRVMMDANVCEARR